MLTCDQVTAPAPSPGKELTMSTPAQLAANIANAQLSSGPRTDTGRATCSKNATTHGLFTQTDFIRPGEEHDYAQAKADLVTALAPAGPLETSLVDEVHRALWRLRRCGLVEATFLQTITPQTTDATDAPDPMQSASTAKLQLSVDRARSQSHRLLHKCTAELRRLQTDRHYAQELFFEGADTSDIGIADWRAITKAHGDRTRVELRQKKLDKLHNTLAMVQRVASEAGRNLTATMQTQSAAENAA